MSDSNIIYIVIFSTPLLSTNVFWAYTNNVDLESLIKLIAMSVLNHNEQLCMSMTFYDIYIIIIPPLKTQMISECTTNKMHLHTLTKADIG